MLFTIRFTSMHRVDGSLQQANLVCTPEKTFALFSVIFFEHPVRKFNFGRAQFQTFVHFRKNFNYEIV